LSHCTPLPTTSIVMVALRFDKGGALEILVQDVTDVKPLSLHHDISTLTGEEIMVFTLAEAPCYREAKKK
jgi:uncharacterized protein YbcI